jgi:hypothetical protein
MNLNQIEMFLRDHNKIDKHFECINELDGRYLDWYLSLMDREPNISLGNDEIERLKSVEEHLLVCFACQDKIPESKDKKTN